MDSQGIRTELRGRALWITIDRPEKLNALNRATVEAIGRAVAGALADEGTAVIVLTGAGEKAFVAGADIAEMASLDARGAQAYSTRLHETLSAIEGASKPVVAAVNGFALGGGCELAMACHVRYAASTARFGQPEVKLGIGPGYGGTVRLPRLVGRGRALELLLTGAMIDAQEAWRIGLVNRVVPAERLMAESETLLREIIANGPLAIRACLESVDGGLGLPLDEALALEANLFGLLSGTADMREGTRAFLEKRKPEFRGE